jgi:hypothetical protein
MNYLDLLLACPKQRKYLQKLRSCQGKEEEVPHFTDSWVIPHQVD